MKGDLDRPVKDLYKLVRVYQPIHLSANKNELRSVDPTKTLQCLERTEGLLLKGWHSGHQMALNKVNTSVKSTSDLAFKWSLWGAWDRSIKENDAYYRHNPDIQYEAFWELLKYNPQPHKSVLHWHEHLKRTQEDVVRMVRKIARDIALGKRPNNSVKGFGWSLKKKSLLKKGNDYDLRRETKKLK